MRPRRDITDERRLAPSPASGGRARTLAFLCHLFLVLRETAHGREADERQRLLYAEDPDAAVVLEYQLHNAPSRDYAGDEQQRAARRQPGSEYDEERHIKPYFLLPNNGPRVVQYYSPWSGRCQFFKSKYISLANEMSLRQLEEQPEVHFHALSCSLYHWICMQNNVKDFPTVVAFKGDSAVPVRLEDKGITAESIATAVGVQLTAPVDTPDAVAAEAGIDILGASANGLARTREAVYVDAALSFVHALKNGIFVEAVPLDADERRAFAAWIDLLYWALPPTWLLHTLINDLRNNIDAVVFSEENLMFMIDKHVEVVTGGTTRWSAQCRRADREEGGNGYACGFWSLLHIASVGVAERHRAVLGVRDRVATRVAARTLRDYVARFFDCAPCREYFVDMFDGCGFDHCRRFKQPQKLPPPKSWEEFPLWMWEVHNDVNAKLAEAEAKREGSAEDRDLDLAAWPPAEACPACRDKHGKWDKAAVLAHLKNEYWPAGVQNFRFVVLQRKDNTQDESTGILSSLWEHVFFLVILAAVAVWFARKQYVSLTGQHKKRDGEHFN